MKLWKVKVTKCQSDIEGKCCISQKDVERIFDDFDDAIAFINSREDYWTKNINPHIWEYEVSSCRELQRVTREREEVIKHKETSWE